MADFIAVQWRKSLERKGWRPLTGARLPNAVIEYHIVHQGRLYSGRCDALKPAGDTSQPGCPAYVLRLRDLMTVGVWRIARRPAGPHGHNVRPAPF